MLAQLNRVWPANRIPPPQVTTKKNNVGVTYTHIDLSQAALGQVLAALAALGGFNPPPRSSWYLRALHRIPIAE
jgi:hypothetical protein